jgi:Tol biopolymer transport system component
MRALRDGDGHTRVRREEPGLIPASAGTRFRFTIEEDGTRLAPPAVSPDGSQFVFGIVDAKGQRILVRRSIEQTAPAFIAGTENGLCPFWSPDGGTLGFFSDGKLRKVSMRGGSPVTLAEGATNPRGATWNRKETILFSPSANSGLFAVSEDGGAPVQVTFPDTALPDISHRWPVFLPDWDQSTGRAMFDVSANGTLLCRETRPLLQTRLVWFDRAGTPVDTVSAALNFRQVVVARDGSGAAACIAGAAGDGDIWLLDFARGLTSRYTNTPADEQDPVLSRDGRSVAYASDVGGPFHVFVAPADRSRAPERVSPPADDWNLLDASPDGRLMLLATATDLWAIDVERRHAQRWHTVAGSMSSAGCFSPDARWIAYGSSESGRDEIYVRPYPGPGGQWQVSIGGGLRPHWSSDGREIVYANLDGDLMAVQVDAQEAFRVESPRRLFRVGPMMPWAANGDHSRFLAAVRSPDAVDPPLKVVTAFMVGR